MDTIFVEGFVGHTIIGIDAPELERAQPLVIDVEAGLVRARACDTDRIGDTIHYGLVVERLRRLMVEHRLTLLEAFAERIAEILIDEFGARWVRVRVVKPKKFEDVAAVGVRIERLASEREERRAVAPNPASARPGHTAEVVHLLASGMLPGRR